MSREGVWGIAAIFGTVGLGFSAFWFVSNYTILHNRHDVVTEARLVWTGGAKPMSRLPWGDYIVRVDGDAGIEITCRDGTVTNGGYVTGLMAEDYTVTRDCKIIS
ncbi:hypothetical protein P8R33_00920 [Qipengyuania sp. XHP0211]|uniref:hypothetical protein n=1 Tax=Qipengyuania sp. XHP0211 TaxID=3038079 RepID=UPI00241F4430|nr:hypothetical protein [Qipengyuania sp. XHP0211]MDG5749663.1 hypothetical protein [Qipengyuania sp. XHP0211]